MKTNSNIYFMGSNELCDECGVQLGQGSCENCLAASGEVEESEISGIDVE